MDKSIMYDFLQTILIGLDTTSIKIVEEIMKRQRINIVKGKDIFYIEDDGYLIELNEINRLFKNKPNSVPKKSRLHKIKTVILALRNIQNGDLDIQLCNHRLGYCSCCINTGIEINKFYKDMSIRYLFEKVKTLQNELSLLKSK